MAKLSDIPMMDHWAIISERSVYHEGDERSRTNPGHGHPAYSETFLEYTSYKYEEDWKKDVVSKTLRKDKFVAIAANPAQISTEVKVAIK